MTAISGHGIKATAAQLMEASTKARENGERYAQITAENAAAVARRAKPRLTQLRINCTVQIIEMKSFQ